jgi:hypothetical protein
VNIDEWRKTIVVTLPRGTALTSLDPSIEVSSGADVSPKTAQNFLTADGSGYKPVVYTVTAEDGSEAYWTATVTWAPMALEEVADYLDGTPPANTGDGSSADNPIILPVHFSFVNQNAWGELLNAIETADKFVALDLSVCTINSMQFNPDYTVSIGKGKIVSLALPSTTLPSYAGATIKDGTQANPTFEHFTNLKSVAGGGFTIVGSWTFAKCDQLKTVSLPAALSIGLGVFYNCGGLETVDLPAATSIGNYAFEGCTALASIALPASLINIDGNPFVGCTTLDAFTVAENNPNYKHSGDQAMLLSKDGKTLISYPTATGAVTLSGITTIGNYAFDGCTGLTSVDLSAATTIGQYAFYQCIDLETVILSSATSIGGAAFSSCTALETVTLTVVTSIGSNAFSGCSVLETANLSTATSIGDYAFSSCHGLTSVNLSSAKTIGDNAFSSCIGLSSVSLPVAQTIGDDAFFQCTGLTSADLQKAETIGDYAFSQCINLETADLPAATSIGDGAFSFCYGLTSADLPAAQTIGNNAFEYTGTAKALTITLGDTPPELGTEMFSEVTGGTKTVTVEVPDDNAAWSGLISGSPYTGNDSAANWGNAFRGMGWDGESCLTGTVNENITLTIQAETP